MRLHCHRSWRYPRGAGRGQAIIPAACGSRSIDRPGPGRPKVARRGSLDGVGQSRTHNVKGAGSCQLLRARIPVDESVADGPISTGETRSRLLAVRKQRPVTWADVGYKNAGFRATARALKFALAWGLATAELGREPKSIEEYAETVEESRATAYRDHQAFRKAFPDEVSPARMNEAAGAQERYDELVRSLRSFSKSWAAAQPMVYALGGSPVVPA